MNGKSVSFPHDQTGPVTASWLISCLLHGCLAIAAILFVQRLQLAPQASSFQWDVAMVTPLSSSPGSTSRSETTAPPTAALQQQVLPAKTQVQQRTRPVMPPAPTPIAEVSPELHQEQSHPDSLSSAATIPSPHVARQDLSGPSTDPVMPLHESSTGPRESPVATDSPVDSSAAIVALAPPNQTTSTKADYGWLAELMARWIEDLNKRYPATLRTEGVQGKVVLTAMLDEHGVLSDVRIAKCSGNAALDDVALEDVRRGPPINLSRPLERTRMPVKFSISYDLKTAR